MKVGEAGISISSLFSYAQTEAAVLSHLYMKLEENMAAVALGSLLRVMCVEAGILTDFL